MTGNYEDDFEDSEEEDRKHKKVLFAIALRGVILLHVCLMLVSP